jgi:hypothetical protein
MRAPILAFLTCVLLVCGCTAALALWTEQQHIPNPDPANWDLFGWAVALDGDTALVGIYGDDDDGEMSGSAYVFVRNGVTWTQEAKLKASDAGPTRRFGYAVAIDGDTAVIGAFQDNHAGDFSGSAYVFVRNAGVWTQQAKLTADDAAMGQEFGYSVAVQGDTAVVGAQGDPLTGPRNGSAYVFVRNGTNWTQEQKLFASDTDDGDEFGSAVAVDGDTVLVGAEDGHHAALTSPGTAYVFVRVGGNWSEQAKLVAPDLAQSNKFGTSVAIQGDTALIGSTGTQDAGLSTGAAYVYLRGGTNWGWRAKLNASDMSAEDLFGRSVSLDNGVAVIGSYLDDAIGFNSGSAYVFEGADTNWTEVAQLTASNGGGMDSFGQSVSISGDTILVGAMGPNNSAGAAYVFLDAVAADRDGDTVPDQIDNCPDDPNPTQLNSDTDLHGDACDNCPNDDNPTQANSDTDDFGDACDNCPNDDNPTQANSDTDPFGDACDNCPNDDNPGQEDLDGDFEGDVCDPDADGDGVNAADGDCDDMNADLMLPTVEVTGVMVAQDGPSDVIVTWDSQETTSGSLVVYDVLMGALPRPNPWNPSDPFPVTVCAAGDISGNTHSMQMWTMWVLVRAGLPAPCGEGTYGDSTIMPDPRDDLDAGAICP